MEMCSTWLSIHSPHIAVSQRANAGGDRAAQGLFKRMAGTHLVGDRADAADAGGDVRDLPEIAATQKASKKRGGSKISRCAVGHLVLVDGQAQHALALNAGQRVDSDRSRVRLFCRFAHSDHPPA